MESSPPFLSGRLLLAMPGMSDPRFDHAVIALAVHDENGAVGIGIGHKRAGIRFRSLLKQLGIEPGRGFVLHSEDWGGQDTVHIVGPNGNYALTGTIDILKAIAEGKGPSQWLIALGYAGWGEGQLEEEMTRHGWFTAAGSPAILFDTPADERWETAFQAEGIDPRLLASETGAA